VQLHILGTNLGDGVIPVTTPWYISIDEYRSSVLGSWNDAEAA
jgi:hypothetical protein